MIHARELTRSFTTKTDVVEAVAGIDLDVEEGELVAFLGPNGAGKTTTLRMLTTLLPPTSGTATVAGHDVVREPAAVRRRIGYIGQGNGAGHYHHVRDELVLQARAYGFGWREARRRADELLAALHLEAMAKRTAGTLSGGQRRRLDIAMGLVHAPPLLFLDEPSTGLDPQNRAHLWDHVLNVRERFGTTLFLTTHYLDEADTMAERVMIIDHGRVIADDTPAALKADLAGDRVTLALADPGDAGPTREVAERLTPLHAFDVDPPAARAAPGSGPGARAAAGSEAGSGSEAGATVGGPGDGTGAVIAAQGGAGAEPGAGVMVRLRVPGGSELLPPLLRELDRSGIAVRSAELARPTLDDVFLTLTGRSLREEEGIAADGASADGADAAAQSTTSDQEVAA